ncbi:hypothetical protein D5018_05140 [Parashewanella curva]|uniref:Uncharacterized protein n=1 Tax=Parashewanella curva TaxID=2338552 RepID=A0A3L8PZP2_9GAMM|nr:hypothetical protein [Parashewanella curva]RLV60854.1 hypothetical protein D5018_05140 [Parashewanella curva]
MEGKVNASSPPSSTLSEWKVLSTDSSNKNISIEISLQSGETRTYQLKATDISAFFSDYIDKMEEQALKGFCSNIESTPPLYSLKPNENSTPYLNGLVFHEQKLYQSILKAQQQKFPTNNNIDTEQIKQTAKKLALITLLAEHIGIQHPSQKRQIQALANGLHTLAHLNIPSHLPGLYQISTELGLVLMIAEYGETQVYKVLGDGAESKFFNIARLFMKEQLNLFHPFGEDHALELYDCFTGVFECATDMGAGRGLQQVSLQKAGMDDVLACDIAPSLMPWPDANVEQATVATQLKMHDTTDRLYLCSQPEPDMLQEFIESNKSFFVYFSGNCQIYAKRNDQNIHARLLNFKHYPIHHPFSAPCLVGFNMTKGDFALKLSELPPQYVLPADAKMPSTNLIGEWYKAPPQN